MAAGRRSGAQRRRPSTFLLSVSRTALCAHQPLLERSDVRAQRPTAAACENMVTAWPAAATVSSSRRTSRAVKLLVLADQLLDAGSTPCGRRPRPTGSTWRTDRTSKTRSPGCRTPRPSVLATTCSGPPSWAVVRPWRRPGRSRHTTQATANGSSGRSTTLEPYRRGRVLSPGRRRCARRPGRPRAEDAEGRRLLLDPSRIRQHQPGAHLDSDEVEVAEGVDDLHTGRDVQGCQLRGQPGMGGKQQRAPGGDLAQPAQQALQHAELVDVCRPVQHHQPVPPWLQPETVEPSSSGRRPSEPAGASAGPPNWPACFLRGNRVR